MGRVSHVEIYVSDYAKSIRFYDLILPFLGWNRIVCQTSHTTFSDGEMKIVFCPATKEYAEAGYHRKRVGLNHLALYANSKQQVDEFYQKILNPNDIACLYEGRPTGDPDYYAVFFEDPDRIKIEVVYAPGYCEPHHWTNRLDDDFDPYSTEQ
jgi:catechol 2,3-dioxygenase-like lactoylglutathione lyase family enzyme